MGGENNLPDEDLVPDGSMLGSTEMGALQRLNQLCKEFGYGRIPQLAQYVSELWRAKLRRCGPGPWAPDERCPVCQRPIDRYPSGRFRYHVVGFGKPCRGAGWRGGS